jgi:Xaa-Pro aminopeptidase
MSTAMEILLPPPSEGSQAVVDLGPDRRMAVDARQTEIAALLRELGVEGLLITEQENFSWLTGGGSARTLIDPAAAPCLFFTADQRWILCCNADSQRLFDEEVDGLGFLLKEWPWHWGREQLLADLCHGRKIAVDRQRNDAEFVGDRLRRRRRTMDRYEQACYAALGQILTHALEATCRTLNVGETEREVAGQISHRMLHRGVQPLVVSVAADGRSRLYRQPGFTSVPVKNYVIVSATARKYGLNATASRTMCLGEISPDLRREHDAANKVSAAYIAATWPDAVPREVLQTGRRIYQICDFEHEWQLAPQGWITGRAPVELALTPKREDLFTAGLAITWRACAGAALSCDTFIVSDDGPISVTPVEYWPLRRIRISGAEFLRPEILQR